MTREWGCAVILAAFALGVGCDQQQVPTSPETPQDPADEQAATEPSANFLSIDSLTENLPGIGAPQAGQPADAAQTRVRAQAGVGQQGRSLDNETGIARAIAEPAKSLFAFRERAVFEIQIPQALQLFRATEGRLPNSHDEFMTRIVRENQLRLPELPSGQRYEFDPSTGELMVVRPAQ